MSELRDVNACPLCGGSAHVGQDGSMLFIMCNDGCCSTKGYASRPEAIKGWNERTESTQLEQVTKERDEFASIARVLLKAAKQYVDYEHDGDPWSEDARTMGEMEINDLYNEGKLDEFNAKLNQ